MPNPSRIQKAKTALRRVGKHLRDLRRYPRILPQKIERLSPAPLRRLRRKTAAYLAHKKLQRTKNREHTENRVSYYERTIAQIGQRIKSRWEAAIQERPESVYPLDFPATVPRISPDALSLFSIKQLQEMRRLYQELGAAYETLWKHKKELWRSEKADAQGMRAIRHEIIQQRKTYREAMHAVENELFSRYEKPMR